MKFSVWEHDDYDDKDLVDILGTRDAKRGQIVSYQFTDTKVGCNRYKILLVWDGDTRPTKEQISAEYAKQLEEIDADEEIAQLEELCTKLNIGEEILDEAVHEIVSQQASEVNNEGVDGQLRFLLKSFDDISGLKTWLNDRAPQQDNG